MNISHFKPKLETNFTTDTFNTSDFECVLKRFLKNHFWKIGNYSSVQGVVSKLNFSIEQQNINEIENQKTKN